MPCGTPGRLTHLNRYFKADQIQDWPGFGEVRERGKLENHYQFVTLHGKKWLVLSLEMGPREAVVAWANRVLKKHREHPAIVLTHGYLYYDNVRYDHRRGKQRATPYNFYGEGADGEMLWNQLIRKHPNTQIVICGHLSSAYVGYRKDEADYGNVVHQMLVDYEKMRGGGRGFLRLLEFLPDRKTVQVRTYSPVTGEIRSPITKGENPLRDPALEEFRFTLQPATRDQPRAVPEGTRDDWLWYCFRNRQTHRAELCDGGHNEDIQSKGLPVKAGQPLHVVLTYDEETGGQPILTAYLNGVRQGPLKTGIKLSELRINGGEVGPFAGIFDEFRVYDYVLSEEQVRACLVAGPDQLPMD